MEFINTIWSALTTENEALCHILGIPLSFIETTMMMLLFTSFLDIKSTSKQKLTFVLTLGCIAILNNTIFANVYTFLINILFNFICIKLVFKTSLLQTLFAVLIPIICATFFEYIITKIVFSMFIIDANSIIFIPIWRIMTVIAIYTLMFFLYLIIRSLKINMKILKNINFKSKLLLLFSIILGIASIAIQSLLTYYYNDKLPVVMTILNWIIIIAYFAINIFSIINVNKLQTKSEELENAELYNKTLSILHDNIRGFKHDFNNIVSTMGGFIYNDDSEGLKKYYSQLQADCIKVNNLAILNPNIINNPGVYSLLTNKYYSARELDIDINLEFFIDLNELHMPIYEFTRILGILLDNAIEASKECNEKIINISFRKYNSKHCQIISIENTYSDKNVNIDKIFEKGISSKENHSGLGLWEIRQLLKKHNNINLHTTKNDKYFTQQLEIYY